MNSIKRLARIGAVTLILSTSVIAGEMPGAGVIQDPPKVQSATNLASCEPVTGDNGSKQGKTCAKATPGSLVEAMIIAMQLLASVI